MEKTSPIPINDEAATQRILIVILAQAEMKFYTITSDIDRRQPQACPAATRGDELGAGR